MTADGSFSSITLYFLLSQSSKTPLCTNIKPRHCSTASQASCPRVMIQLETSFYIDVKHSHIWDVHKLPPFPILQELWTWSKTLFFFCGVWLSLVGGTQAHPTASAVREWWRSAAWWLPLSMACPRRRVMSALKALLFPLLLLIARDLAKTREWLNSW